MSRFALLVLSLFLAACSPGKIAENQLTPAERNLFRGAIDDLARGDIQSLERRVPPELVNRLRPAESAMVGVTPRAPVQMELLNAAWSVSGARSAKVVYQVHGSNRWAIVEAASQTQGGRTVLTAIYVQPLKDEARKLNGFNLAAAGLGQWSVLIAAIAAFVTTVAALIRIWRSGLFDRRWLWTVGALFGIMMLSVNWTTGQMAFQPFRLQLFSASALKQPVFAPWVISASLPLVAIIALLRRRGPLSEPRPLETQDVA